MSVKDSYIRIMLLWALYDLKDLFAWSERSYHENDLLYIYFCQQPYFGHCLTSRTLYLDLKSRCKWRPFQKKGQNIKWPFMHKRNEHQRLLPNDNATLGTVWLKWPFCLIWEGILWKWPFVYIFLSATLLWALYDLNDFFFWPEK